MKNIRLAISLFLLTATMTLGSAWAVRTTHPSDIADMPPVDGGGSGGGGECNCTDGWTGRPGLLYYDYTQERTRCRPDGCYIITRNWIPDRQQSRLMALMIER